MSGFHRASSGIPSFLSIHTSVAPKKRRIGGTSTDQQPVYENFRNIGRNIPILVLLPSCSVNQHRNRFGDRLYARFVLCIQKPCRATWHPAALLTTLSKYSRYLNLSLDVSLLTSWNCKWSYLFVVRLLFREFHVQTKWKKKRERKEKNDSGGAFCGGVHRRVGIYFSGIEFPRIERDSVSGQLFLREINSSPWDRGKGPNKPAGRLYFKALKSCRYNGTDDVQPHQYLSLLWATK